MRIYALVCVIVMKLDLTLRKEIFNWIDFKCNLEFCNLIRSLLFIISKIPFFQVSGSDHLFIVHILIDCRYCKFDVVHFIIYYISLLKSKKMQAIHTCSAGESRGGILLFFRKSRGVILQLGIKNPKNSLWYSINYLEQPSQEWGGGI